MNTRPNKSRLGSVLPRFRFASSMVTCFVLSIVLLNTKATTATGQEKKPRDLGTRKQGSDWPTFLGSNTDSKSAETGILTDWNQKSLRIVWQRPLGESYGIGSVSRGRYFQFDYENGRATLFCLNAETGEELWKFDYPSDYQDLYGYDPGPRCSPIVEGNRVYVFGVEGMIHALEVDSGKLIWKKDTNKEYGVIQNFFGVGSNPVLYEDLLIAMVGGSPADDQALPPGRLDLVKPNGSLIVAFDKSTGEEKYRTGNDLASYASLKIANLRGKPHCLAFARSGLFVFQPNDGKEVFSFPWRDNGLESVNASVPVVFDDKILISETYGPGGCVIDFAQTPPSVVWSDDTKRREKSLQTHWNTAVYHDGFFYGCSGRHTSNAELRCVDALTGEVKWSQPELTRTSLLYVDGHFISLGEDGVLQLIKATPEQYELVGELKLVEPAKFPLNVPGRPLLRYPCWAAPILSHGLLYVRGKDRLICLELIPEKKP